MKFEKDFKIAISNLSSKEKDKLIMRLLKKDITLANRLYFELVSTDSVEDRRSKQEKHIITSLNRQADRSYSPGILMILLREFSGEIAEHVKTTKDKYGEPYLNLILLIETLKFNHENISKLGYSYTYKLFIYIISKAFKILILINSLHEDFHLEFEDKLIELGNQISKYNMLMKVAIQNGFDINWLLSADIPENIKEIHKNVRAQGLLR